MTTVFTIRNYRSEIMAMVKKTAIHERPQGAVKPRRLDLHRAGKKRR